MIQCLNIDDVVAFEDMKVKTWLSQERKELSKWNKKTFFLVSKVLSFRHTKQTSKRKSSKTNTLTDELIQRTSSKLDETASKFVHKKIGKRLTKKMRDRIKQSQSKRYITNPQSYSVL